jgi:hypothetical protein
MAESESCGQAFMPRTRKVVPETSTISARPRSWKKLLFIFAKLFVSRAEAAECIAAAWLAQMGIPCAETCRAAARAD